MNKSKRYLNLRTHESTDDESLFREWLLDDEPVEVWRDGRLTMIFNSIGIK